MWIKDLWINAIKNIWANVDNATWWAIWDVVDTTKAGVGSWAEIVWWAVNKWLENIWDAVWGVIDAWKKLTDNSAWIDIPDDLNSAKVASVENTPTPAIDMTGKDVRMIEDKYWNKVPPTDKTIPSWEVVTDVPIEDVPVADTPPIEEPVVEEIKEPTPEQIKSEDEAKLDEFNNLLDSGWSAEDISKFAKENPALLPSIRMSVKKHFKDIKNLEFFNTYSWMSDKQLYDAMKNWDFAIWDEKYSLLSPEQRTAFENFNNLKTAETIWDKTEMVTLEDYVVNVDDFFSTDIRSEIEKMMNDPAYTQLQTDMQGKQDEIGVVDDSLKAIDESIRSIHKWVPRAVIDWIIADKQKVLLNKKNTLINEFNSMNSRYSNMRDDIDLEVKLLDIEDKNEKYVYEQALAQYNSDREAMASVDKMKFEEQNKILAENRKMQNDLALYEAKKLVDAWDRELKMIWDRLFTVKKDWTDAKLVIDWEAFSSTDWKYVSVQNFEEDWVIKSVFTNKSTLQQWIVTSDANWDKVWDYLDNLWTWNITWYGWDYDWGLWLDVDWAMGQGFFAPMWWTVEFVWEDKNYWKYIQVKLDDWNYVQYAHLDEFVPWFEEWTKFWKDNMLWTIWNTWNVLSLNWDVPSAEQLKNWVWSHLDITSFNSDYSPRTSQDTEAYLRSLSWKTKLNKEDFDQQKWIIKEFKSLPLIKEFESWLINSRTLLTSLSTETWAWDMAWIFQFMKSLDPNSVVRESEFQLAWSTAWIPQTMVTKFMGYKEWDKLAPSVREDFKKLAIAYMKIRAVSYDNDYNDALRLYEQQGLPISSFPKRASEAVWNLWNDVLALWGWKEFDYSEFNKMYEESLDTSGQYYND